MSQTTKMSTMAFFLLFSLLSSIGPLSVYSEETPVFVLKGQDVRLELKKHVNQDEIIVLIWKFNEDVVVRYVPMSEDPVLKEYKNKAIFSKENFSLLIKNLQEADSGSYSVTVTRSVKEIKNLYLIVVQDKVDPPVLTVAWNTFTADSCNMTVTCRTLNTSVSSTCNNITCSQVGGDRGGVVTSTAPLLIYVSGGSIICNHSNQVSWAEDTKEIKALCTLYPTGMPPVGVSVYMLKIVLFSVGLVLMVSALLTVHIMEKLSKKD
ncbi:uncharacterized protein [Osmerus mordax]|uniref:uncharacterized protein n=1 Tax=Osmerus mordax TaxID=8014 RepID=UPI00350FC0AC